MIEHVEGAALVHKVEAFAEKMLRLANQADEAGALAVELTARDAGEALLALLDVLEHGRNTVELRTI